MNSRRKQKGQIASIVMTIVFLVVAVAITFFAIFTLIATKGSQLELSVTVLGGTSQPVNFASGAASLRDREGRSVIEQGIQAIATSDTSLAASAAESIASLVVPFGIENYAITIRGENSELSSTSKVLKFCGRASENKFAYCSREAACPIGSSAFADGQQQCSAGEKCCVDNYDFGKGAYKDIPANYACTAYTYQTFIGPGGTAVVRLPSGGGVCETSCSPGRLIAGDSSGCGSAQNCCTPSRSSRPAASTLSSVSIPLAYRTASGNASKWGSIEIAISDPTIVR